MNPNETTDHPLLSMNFEKKEVRESLKGSCLDARPEPAIVNGPEHIPPFPIKSESPELLAIDAAFSEPKPEPGKLIVNGKTFVINAPMTMEDIIKISATSKSTDVSNSMSSAKRKAAKERKRIAKLHKKQGRH